VTRNVFVLIGAGSTVFTPGLLRDLAASETFRDAEVRLVDVDPTAVQTMAEVGRRIVSARGSGIMVTAHTDRREALPGARFVTTTIAVGSAAGWRQDLDIPARYGIQQTVGDSVGPGGVLRALRHVPELVAIARDIVELAPDALLVNYSNPLSANVRAVADYAGIDVIGLCHGTMHTKSALSRDLGVDPADVTATFAGLNHLCWLLDIRTADVDLYPRLRELVAERGQGRDAAPNRSEGVHAPVSADLLSTFGLYPAPGDRHVAEFFGGYLRDEGKGFEWGLDAGHDMTIQYIGEKGSLWDDLRAQADGTAEPVIEASQEAERFVSIAEAIVSGAPTVELAVNVPNRGAIENLPVGAVVEVPAVIDAGGVTPVSIGRLPDAIAAVLTARALQQHLTVRAAVERDAELAVQALALDPLVPSTDVARAILADAIAAGGFTPRDNTDTQGAQ
jgi:alpha-galactosidase